MSLVALLRISPSGVRGALSISALSTSILAGCTGTTSQPTPAGTLDPQTRAAVVIRGVSVVDVVTGDVLPEHSIVIEGRHIGAVGPTATTRVPGGAAIIDGTGAFAIPGLWDMHVHFPNGHDRHVVENGLLPLFVARGITRIRDMCGGCDKGSGDDDPNEAAVILRELRGRISDGSLVAPWVAAAGFRVQRRLGIVEDISDMATLVDSLSRVGYDFVKVYEVRKPTFDELARSARNSRFAIAGHIPGGVTVEEASVSGMRSIEHITWLVDVCAQSQRVANADRDDVYAATLQYSRVTAYGRPFDPISCRAIAEILRDNSTSVVPTTLMRGAVPDGHPGRDARFLTLRTRRDQEARSRPLTDIQRRSKQRMIERSGAVLAVLSAAGVNIVAGSDYPEGWYSAGYGLHIELETLVDSGLSPLQALQAATINAARLVGSRDSTGSIAAGQLADLLLLEGDPLADITNTRRISTVVARGRVFDRSELDTILDSVASILAGTQ